MKKLLNIIILFAIVLNSFGQSKIKKDIVEAEEELIIEGLDFTDWLADSTGASIIDGANGLNKDGTDIELGGTLDKGTVISGAGNALTLGTIVSALSSLNIYTSGNTIFTAAGIINLGVSGKVWSVTNDYIINVSNGDTLATIAELEAAIEAAQPLLPYNFDYTFSSSTTDARPGVGFFKFNNATLANVTEVYIDYFDANSVSKNNFLSEADTGSLITVMTDVNNYAIYQLTGLLVDNGNYFTYNVTYSSHSGVISGLSTIDLEMNNTTGSGGGGTATSEHAYFDTISSHNNSFVLFDSAVAMQDTLFIREGKIYNGVSNGITIEDSSLSSLIFLDEYSVLITNDNAVFNPSAFVLGSGTAKIESDIYDYVFINDTLFLNGEEGSTENVIKTSGISVGGGEVVDTTYSSKYVIENTGIGVLQFIDSNIVNPSAGQLWQDSISLTLNYVNTISGTTLNIGEEFRHPVYNNTGVTILDNRVVRRTGSHTNGRRLPTIALSGIGSTDSSKVYGITTMDILTGEVGYVVKHGDINFADTEHLTEDESYLGFAGLQIDTMPLPPYITWKVGEVIYSDADSGIVDVDINNLGFSKTPTLSANFYDSTILIDIATQNVYQQITNDWNNAFNVVDKIGVNYVGDSAQVLVGGQWNIAFSTSFEGTISADTWKEGVFVNGVLQYNTERYTASDATGNISGIVGLNLIAGDWLSFRMVNTTSVRDFIVKNKSISLIFLHL